MSGEQTTWERRGWGGDIGVRSDWTHAMYLLEGLRAVRGDQARYARIFRDLVWTMGVARVKASDLIDNPEEAERLDRAYHAYLEDRKILPVF